MQNPALTILDTGYSLPEGKSIRNHLVTTKLLKRASGIVIIRDKRQGEYNDADLDPAGLPKIFGKRACER